ncbi:MAG: hypothetical protein F4Z86_19500 [Gemmatimonadetes bacterium]|nr:hypothetical protein [Gemmatimonadota bacterium]MYB58064.1 hypothetical protein [Gemmatimonadota bacterium]
MQLEITAKFNAEVFLRSINIQYDAEYPNRIAHYQPTAKSVPLIRSLLGSEQDRAFFVVAPYGTGKSITATYLLHLVENRSDADETLSTIEDKLKAVSPDLYKFAMERRNGAGKGLVLALQGYCEKLGESLKDAALKGMGRMKLGRQARTIESMPCETIDQAIDLLVAVREKARSADCDRVVILWDEFGRHIESLIAEGRSAALSEIQLLAESVSRSIAIPVTLGLLLHQELLQYASNSPASVRAEWRKIEGRFQTIQYIDDSKEIYRLLSEVVSEQNRSNILPDKQVKSSALECKQLGLFSDFTISELQSLLCRAYPLEPTTLYLLPRISGRVAQNERTLFSFLNFIDFQNSVSPDHLYEYFSPDMRTDTAVGGTYKQWLETQNALSKLDDDNGLAATALRTASLLGFGVSGERSRTSRDLLLFALRGYGCAGAVSNGSQEEGEIVDQLIDKKLLLHRKHSDEVSVWHGTDADLRGRLEEEKSRQRRTFDFLTFLTDEANPPVWRPVMYNSDFHIRRFLQGEYWSLEKLDECLNMPVGCDGKIIYVIAETAEELQEAENLTSKYLCDERVILAVPRVPVPLFEAALEVWCLTQMQEDDKLVESDPMVLSEIQQMTDDARSYLQKLLDRLILPGSKGPRWFYKGSELPVKNAYDLRNALSEIMETIFHYTPKINNEMIVRHKPTPTVVNSRKKLLLGILERSGQEMLDIEGNPPEASMFRTVLLHTGLYYTDKGEGWKYALPDRVTEPGLQKVWSKIQQFFTDSSEEPKDIRGFFDELMEPPFGIRAGLLPILFAAGLKTFPSVYSLRYKGGGYVSDILPSEIEQLCREPEDYEFIVIDLDQTKCDYLNAIHELFGSQAISTTGNDLIRACYDALENWKMGLPTGALSTRYLTQKTRRFQAILRHQSDPVQLLFERIPRALDCSIDEQHVLLKSLEKCKNELSKVIDDYQQKAISSLRRALSLNWKSGNGEVKEIANRWALCFPDEISDALNDNKSKSLLSRMRMTYKSDAKLVDSLSGLFFQKTISRWDDSYIVNFDREIHNAVKRIEESALSFEFKASGAVKNGLANLVQERMNIMYERLIDIVGPEEARTLFARILKKNTGEDLHGDHPRGVEQSV